MAISTVLFMLLAGIQDPSSGATSSESTATNPASQRRICRQQERLGTILPRRTCRTAAEWAEIDAAQARATDRNTAHMRNNGRGSLCDAQTIELGGGGCQ